MLAALLGAAAAASSAEKTITNGLVTASFSADCSLAAVGLKDGAQQQVRGDGWEVELANRTHSSKALRPSLKVSQPSASELLCEWDGGISVRYSAPPQQGFVQKQLSASAGGGAELAIGRVSPTTELEVGAAGTPHFSLDAGGVFVRQANEDSAGLMAVVQNKHTSLASSTADMTWSTHAGQGYRCTSSEYKGTAPDSAGTAAGCLAAAEKMAGLGVDYATFHGGSCYVCSVAGDVAAKLSAMPGQTSFVGKHTGTKTNHTATAATLTYAAGLPEHPMVVPSPFMADLVLFAPYEQSETLWEAVILQRSGREEFGTGQAKHQAPVGSTDRPAADGVRGVLADGGRVHAAEALQNARRGDRQDARALDRELSGGGRHEPAREPRAGEACHQPLWRAWGEAHPLVGA